MTTVFGKVEYKRAYYAGCVCGKGRAPLDQAYGLEAGAISSGLGQLMALAGIAFSFEESVKWLKEFLLFEVSENSIRSETQQMGRLQQACEEQAVLASQDEKALQDRLRGDQQPAQRLYGSMDAAKVRIEPRARQGKPVAEHEDWRDMKVACWYQAEEVPKSRQSVRQRHSSERDGRVFRSTQHHYSCDIAHVDQFGKLLWASGCQAAADLVTDLVFVCDGASWIWSWSHTIIPTPYKSWIGIMLQTASNAWRMLLFPLRPIAKTGWTQSPNGSGRDRSKKSFQTCNRLAGKHAEAKQAATYFSNNHHRMRYDVFRSQAI